MTALVLFGAGCFLLLVLALVVESVVTERRARNDAEMAAHRRFVAAFKETGR